MSRQPPLGPWFWALIGATFLAQAAVFAARPMTSYRAMDLGAGTVGVGVIAGCFAVLPLVLAIPVGRGVDRAGAIGYLRSGAVCLVGGAVVMAAAPTLLVLALGNVIAGVGLLLTAIAAQGIIAHRAEQRDHDRAFGLFTVAASAGQLVGPLLAGLVAHHIRTADGSDSPRAGLLVAAAFAVVLLAVTLAYRGLLAPLDGHTAGGDFASAPGRETPTPRPGVAGILRTRGMRPAMLSSLALLCCVDLITAFLPVLAEERGLSTQAVGWLLALRALASIASRLLVARFAARWGRRLVLAVSMVLAAGALGALPTSASTWVLVPVILTAGFMLGIGQPLTMSWVTELVSAPSRATALAVRLSANRVGQVVVPAVAGVTAGVMGASGVFVLTALLLTSATASVVASGGGAEGVSGDGA